MEKGRVQRNIPNKTSTLSGNTQIRKTLGRRIGNNSQTPINHGSQTTENISSEKPGNVIPNKIPLRYLQKTIHNPPMSKVFEKKQIVSNQMKGNTIASQSGFATPRPINERGNLNLQNVYSQPGKGTENVQRNIGKRKNPNQHIIQNNSKKNIDERQYRKKISGSNLTRDQKTNIIGQNGGKVNQTGLKSSVGNTSHMTFGRVNSKPVTSHLLGELKQYDYSTMNVSREEANESALQAKSDISNNNQIENNKGQNSVSRPQVYENFDDSASNNARQSNLHQPPNVQTPNQISTNQSVQIIPQTNNQNKRRVTKSSQNISQQQTFASNRKGSNQTSGGQTFQSNQTGPRSNFKKQEIQQNTQIIQGRTNHSSTQNLTSQSNMIQSGSQIIQGKRERLSHHNISNIPNSPQVMLYHSSTQGMNQTNSAIGAVQGMQMNVIKNPSLNRMELGYSYQNPDFNVYGQQVPQQIQQNFMKTGANPHMNQFIGQMTNFSQQYQPNVLIQGNQQIQQNQMDISQQISNGDRMLQSQTIPNQIRSNFNVQKFYTEEGKLIQNQQEREEIDNQSTNQLMQMEPLTDAENNNHLNTENEGYLEDGSSQYTFPQNNQSTQDYMGNVNYTKNAMNQVQNLQGIMNQHLGVQGLISQNNSNLMMVDGTIGFRRSNRPVIFQIYFSYHSFRNYYLFLFK